MKFTYAVEIISPKLPKAIYKRKTLRVYPNRCNREQYQLPISLFHIRLRENHLEYTHNLRVQFFWSERYFLVAIHSD